MFGHSQEELKIFYKALKNCSKKHRSEKICAGKEGDAMVRLTQDTVQKILTANEGFEAKTHYSNEKADKENTYFIKDGKMYVTEFKKDEYGSQEQKTSVLDIDRTRRIIRQFEKKLVMPVLIKRDSEEMPQTAEKGTKMEFIAKNGKKLAKCLRMLYAERLPFEVELFEDEKQKVRYRITSEVDPEKQEAIWQKWQIITA